MELVIYSPTPEDFVKAIEWNHDELKTALTNELEKYKHLVFTPDTITDGKRTLADLRRFKTTIEDKRKEVKNQIMAPYLDFEKKVKELTALVDEPIAAIDKQVKNYDEQRRADKLAECEAYFDEKAEELNLTGFIRWESVTKAEYGNVSKSMTQITEEIDTVLNRVFEALKVIDGMESEYTFEMRQTLSQTLDLQQAIAKGQQLKEIAEQKARFEAERQAEQERRAAEREDRAKLIEEAGKAKKEEPVQEETVEEVKPEKPQLYTLRFEVAGTRDQLMQLSRFLKINNYSYTQLKEGN